MKNEVSEYRVVGFIDKDGNDTNELQHKGIVLTSCVKGELEGLGYPIRFSSVAPLNPQVDDVIIEKILKQFPLEREYSIRKKT
jgi:hypothetical protein